MPQAQNTHDRELLDLVAPWFSQETLPVDGKIYPTLVRRKQQDEAGQETDEDEWVITECAARHAERFTLKRVLTHAEAKWVQREAGIFGSFQMGRGTPKLDEAKMADMRTHGYRARVMEVTNAAGIVQLPTKELFDNLCESDLQYLDAAINALDGTIVPVLKADREEAQRRVDGLLDKQARGFPLHHDAVLDVERVAQEQAQVHLLRDSQTDLSGEW